jgi:hypothetical protein
MWFLYVIVAIAYAELHRMEQSEWRAFFVSKYRLRRYKPLTTQ